ncbi:hypothetical protein [Shewanella vesiculosa]|uniref:hypothetical protein n=1 Tax=Shewanella vesiculosa TaxID=518738 RepID=UPI00384E353C
MITTHIKNGMILEVYNNDYTEYFDAVLYGEVTNDETLRFDVGFRLISSPITETNENITVFYTKSHSRYELDNSADTLKITAHEWLLMREQLISPDELIALRIINLG